MKQQKLWELERGMVKRPRGKPIFFVKTSGGEIAFSSPIDRSEVIDDTHDMTDRKKIIAQSDSIGIEVVDMVSNVVSVQRLGVLIFHYKHFSFPEPLGREIALLALLSNCRKSPYCRQDSYDRVHRAAALRYKQQIKELLGVNSCIITPEDRSLHMLSLMPSSVPLILAHDGYVSISIDNFSWSGTLEDQVKLIPWLRNFDSEGRIPAHRYAFLVQKSSVGDRLFTAPYRSGTPSWIKEGSNYVRSFASKEYRFPSFRGGKIPEVPNSDVYFSVPVDMWRYERIVDERLLRLLGGEATQMDLRKKDPDTYLYHMDSYEALVGTKHDKIVLSLAEKLKIPVVVPGDGLGRFARLWPYPCESSDINISPFTHVKVKNKSLKEVIKSDPGNCLILMYVWYALDEEDRELIKVRMELKKPTLIIDTRPEISCGRRINNMVYESGLPDLDLPYFEHDSVEKAHGIKFNENLLSLRNPIFEKDSVVGRYYHFMRPFFKPEGPPISVSDTISSFLQKRQYLYHVGRFCPEVLPFTVTSRLFNQVIYFMHKKDFSVIPSTLYREIIGNRVYFCSREYSQTRHLFSGFTSDGEYNIYLTFHERSKGIILSQGTLLSEEDLQDFLKYHPSFTLSILLQGEEKILTKTEEGYRCERDLFDDITVQQE